MKTIDQNPSVADRVLFKFLTTDENNYLIDPYKVESVKIYFVERDFASTQQKEYSYTIGEDEYKLNISGNISRNSRVFRCSDTSNLKNEMLVSGEGIRQGTTISYVIDKVSLMLSYPAEKTINNSDFIFIKESENYLFSDNFYYKTANCIKVVGDSLNPAWLSGDVNNALISKADGIGSFEYVWDSSGVREGDYFVCWSWVPKIGQEIFSNNVKFNLKTSNFLSTSSPAHHTKPGKYETLLDRYLPEMYKMKMTDADRSPDVLQKFNESIAQGFTILEDVGNQIVDLLDANGVSEYIITYLSNTLDVKLKSQDPTLWRRQIKEAVPLYKKKGTIGSIRESLSQAGMRFLGIENYWQITSPFFYQESFFYTASDVDSLKKDFVLTKKAVNVDEYTFDTYLTKYNSMDSVELSFSLINISENEYGETIVTLDESVDMEEGDIVRFSYYYKTPSNTTESNIDDYIKNLPIADTRQEKEIVDGSSKLVLPLKNWNVRLIAEKDPLINSVISSRHPFVKNLVFGKIRTEFPYSENVYNMDEYNGSKRDSTNPCDIDKDFLDPCSYCRSSIFDIDVEVEKLSNDSVTEIRNILTENMPFHSYPKTINLYGGQNEFVLPPIEDYDAIISYKVSDNVIAGEVQQWFYRNKLLNQLKLRNEMATNQSVYTGNLIFKNEKIILFSEDLDFKNLPISENSCILEITSGLNAGSYIIDERIGNYLGVSDVFEPLNSGVFNYKLYNILFNINSNITRDDFLELEDIEESSFDYINNNYKVKINLNGNDYNFDIKNVLPNKKLLLTNNNNIISGNILNKNYSILDQNLNVLFSSTANFKHSYRSVVNLENYDLLLKNDNNYLSFSINSQNYLCNIISHNKSENLVYIDTYNGANAGSIPMEFRQFLTQSSSGYFAYSGLKAVSSENLEQILNIKNGKNGNSIDTIITDSFKEDFVILLKSSVDDPYLINTDNYYFISEIDGSNIWLSGLFEDFGVEIGEQVEVEIYKFTKNNVEILENYFCMSPQPTQCPNNSINLSIDRSGKEIVTSTNSGPPVNFIQQNESVTFELVTLDGNKEKGKI